MNNQDNFKEGIHQRLRNDAKEWWDATVDHTFVDQLFSGEVTNESFLKYIKEDYVVSDSMIQMIGLGIDSAPSMNARRELGRLYFGSYDGYFEDTLAKFGTDAQNLSMWDREQTTREFCRFLRSMGQAGYLQTLTALLAAEWVYAEWTSSRPVEGHHRKFVADWILAHTYDAMKERLEWIRDEVIRVYNLIEIEYTDIQRIFQQTLIYEYELFESAC